MGRPREEEAVQLCLDCWQIDRSRDGKTWAGEHDEFEVHDVREGAGCNGDIACGRLEQGVRARVTATRKASDATVGALRQALAGALSDPALETARKALFLKGVMPAEEESYGVLLDYEEKALELGYARLA